MLQACDCWHGMQARGHACHTSRGCPNTNLFDPHTVFTHSRMTDPPTLLRPLQPELCELVLTCSFQERGFHSFPFALAHQASAVQAATAQGWVARFNLIPYLPFKSRHTAYLGDHPIQNVSTVCVQRAHTVPTESMCTLHMPSLAHPGPKRPHTVHRFYQ